MSVSIDLVAATRIPEFVFEEGDAPFRLRWKNPPPFTDDELLELFALNDGLQFEMDCDGSLIIMSPTGLRSGFRSKSGREQRLQAKMDEYIANGVRLGWLLDPTTRTAYVYRPGVAVQVVENALTQDGSPELPGFVLDLVPIWS